MPSFVHEILVDLFRECPGLAPALVREAGRVELSRETVARVTAGEFADLDIAEFRADVVVRLDDAHGQAKDVLIVDVQLDRDKSKHVSWPLYAISARARLGCLPTLLVICLDDGVARWCAKAIPIDRNGSMFYPMVIGPSDLPRFMGTDQDAERARAFPELAILAAAAHSREGGDDAGAARMAMVALQACEALDTRRSVRYADFILASLGEAARRALENLMSLSNYEFQSDFAKKYVKQGRDEGRRRADEKTGRKSCCASSPSASMSFPSPYGFVSSRPRWRSSSAGLIGSSRPPRSRMCSPRSRSEHNATWMQGSRPWLSVAGRCTLVARLNLTRTATCRAAGTGR